MSAYPQQMGGTEKVEEKHLRPTPLEGEQGTPGPKDSVAPDIHSKKACDLFTFTNHLQTTGE